MLTFQESPFRGSGVELYRRTVAPSEPWARLGILHGYGDHSGRYAHCMERLAEAGVLCHALDFRGHGRASGRRGHVGSWDEYIADLDAFLGLPEVREGEGAGLPLFLLGHSHGALVMAAAGIRGLPRVSGCIMSAPYLGMKMQVRASKRLAARVFDRTLPWLPIPSGLRDEWMSSDEEMLRDSRGDPLIFRTATPRWYSGALAAQAQVMTDAPEFRLPLLVLAAEGDPVADPRAAHDFFERAGSEDKTYRLFLDHLHELLRESGRERIFAVMLEWMRDRSA